MNELLRTILFLPPQASTMARTVDTLHYFVILTTMAGATAVTAVGGWFIVKYRRRERPTDSQREPVTSPPASFEIAVTVGLFALFVFWWWIGFRQYVQLRVAPPDAMTVYVTAKQWMWKFAYPEGNHSIAALYVPTGKPVQLVMTSRDVIHSFYVPDFRIKQDVLPGRYTTVWFEVKEPGTHQILCAEYCGTNHSVMRGDVVALAPADWARWVAGDKTMQAAPGPRYEEPASVDWFDVPTNVRLPRMGERAAADHGCLRCHTVDGTPHIGPTWAGLYGSLVPLSDGRTVVADEAYLTESMMDPAAKVHRGFQPVMPSYLGLLAPTDAAAIVEFMKTLRDVPPESDRGDLAPRPSGLPPPGEIGQPPVPKKPVPHKEEAP